MGGVWVIFSIQNLTAGGTVYTDAADQKHWHDGLPYMGTSDGGDLKHWYDGLPYAYCNTEGGGAPATTTYPAMMMTGIGA